MLRYKIVFEKSAEKYIKKQDKLQQERILKTLLLLPNQGDIKHLSGTSDLFRVRIGDIRATFRVNNDTRTVTIDAIGSRGQIYNKI